jgi:hypothetical protein
MYELFDVLEKHGFVGIDDLDKIADLPEKKLEKLYTEVYSSVFSVQTTKTCGWQSSHLPDTFSFHASASIRGASGCGAPECRIKKLDFLSRYAALYASELTFPLSMEAPERVEHIADMRGLLERDLPALLYLRPLITGGIVVPVMMRTQHCIHHAKWMKKMSLLVHDFSQAAAEALSSEFRIMYQIPEKSPSGRPTLYFEGPDGYIEHGALVALYSRKPKWLPKTLRFDRNGRVEVRGPHKQHMLSQVFEGIAHNMTFYLAYGAQRNTRFLSDMYGETEFLEWLTEDDQLSATSVALRELHHCVPLLNDLPIATILRIRKEEHESFENYRETVTTISSEILGDNHRLTKKQAREMFRTAIEPELRKMNKEMVAYRETQRNRVVGGVTMLVAGVVLGAYAGLPPMASIPLAGATVGAAVRVLGKAAEAACEHVPETKKKDLYFLLKLKEERDR